MSPTQNPYLGTTPVFDPVPHLIRLILIRCGQLLYPEEKNISVLIEKVSEAIGLFPIETATNHNIYTKPPQPLQRQISESIKPTLCPKCGKESIRLFPICHGCTSSEGGKYKTTWACKYQKVDADGTLMFNPYGLPILVDGCGYEKKSEKSTTEWLDELKIPYENQSKRSLGIQTLTDKGVE